MKGGNYGGTNGAKRVIAVDATGLPMVGLVFPANIDEPKTVRALLQKLDDLLRAAAALQDLPRRSA